MRIITGTAKGTKLVTLSGDNTRPTAERAKEAIFSMLQFDIEGRRVLDLFAGSGQLGLEALSRGADSCVFSDFSSEALKIVKENAAKTRLADRAEFILADYAKVIEKSFNKGFDLIFLDPPYASSFLCSSLNKLYNSRLMNEGCILVCESEDGDVFSKDATLAEKFERKKFAGYGRVHIELLTPVSDYFAK